MKNILRPFLLEFSGENFGVSNFVIWHQKVNLRQMTHMGSYYTSPERQFYFEYKNIKIKFFPCNLTLLWRKHAFLALEQFLTFAVVPISRQPLDKIQKLFLQWTKKGLGHGVSQILVDWSLPINR